MDKSPRNSLLLGNIVGTNMDKPKRDAFEEEQHEAHYTPSFLDYKMKRKKLHSGSECMHPMDECACTDAKDGMQAGFGSEEQEVKEAGDKWSSRNGRVSTDDDGSSESQDSTVQQVIGLLGKSNTQNINVFTV